MDTTIDRIKSKLIELRQKDRELKTFGSESHQYNLGPRKSEVELAAFEQRYGIALPKGYRKFLLEIGDGGAGPYYGLGRLEYALSIEMDSPMVELDPSKPFPHTEAWNMSFDEAADDEEYFRQRDEIYYNDQWINGVLRIAHFGCGVFMNLVVKGPEYGHVWVDDRGSDQGIYPDQYFGNKERLDFLTWYELWLDQSMQKLPPQSSDVTEEYY